MPFFNLIHFIYITYLSHFLLNKVNEVILHFGSNIGDRLQNLYSAYTAINEQIGTVEKKSSVYETEAWGNKSQSSFLNSAILITTALSPFQLLDKTQNIEKKLGRIKKEKWGPRIIDIDIIFYNHIQLKSSLVTIPHQQYVNRKFVLKPICDISPLYKDPQTGITVAENLKRCPDDQQVANYCK